LTQFNIYKNFGNKGVIDFLSVFNHVIKRSSTAQANQKLWWSWNNTSSRQQP
jgi:hypothetical protein